MALSLSYAAEPENKAASSSSASVQSSAAQSTSVQSSAAPKAAVQSAAVQNATSSAATSVQDASISIDETGTLQLLLPQPESFSIKIYTTSGKKVLKLSGDYPAGTTTIKLSEKIPANDYLLSVQGKTLQILKSITVK